ncbi:choice-of-anchor L domain-containing protein [Tenacibaculum sp. 190524A05c]|uniref:choice-of-anchor L domain-containing protein n=1 Tax=Tenacibaculum platacis TaxID=3137852 RepID=UPI0032B303F5
MNRTKITLLVVLLFSLVGLNAQVDVNNTAEPESNFTPEQLISDVLITGACNTVSNVTSAVSGTPTDQPTKNYGFFKRQAGSSFPFEEGIVLTSGIANRIQAGASGGALSTSTTGNTDADLANAIGVIPGQISDAAVIEFDFVPKSTRISFRYLMASQEYQGTFPCNFADSFAFLLRQSTSTTYENIALVPGTTTPVSVTNVHAEIPNSGGATGCAAVNEAFFAGSDVTETGFVGRTVVLTAQADVVPNVTYHIKLVVADFSDRVVDTAVFLEKGSFNLGLNLGNDLTISGSNSVCGDSTLLTANVSATSYKWFKDGVEITGETSQTYLANLGNGTYTCEIDDGGCKDSDDIVLEFSEPATAIPAITDLSNCENNIFDLTARTAEILNGQDPATFEVLFFTDSAFLNQITTPTSFTSPSDDETIYVRKRNRTANHCFTEGSFRILNFDNPVGQTAINYEECDDVANGGDTDGFFNNFILSTKDAEVLGSLSPTTFNVSYHTTLTGAQTDSSTDAIDKNNPYRNATINAQTIYVRIENIANTNCFTVSDPASTTFRPFQLIVHPLPVIANNPALINQCDTDSDLSTSINLTQAEISISANHTNETFKYYPTEADAIANTAEITTPITHTASDGDSVWVRTISNQGCFRISRLDITISFAGDVAYNQEFTSCDDFLDADGNDTINNDDRDGISNFDISPAIDAIRNLFDPAIRNDLDILFFETTADRDAVINQIPDPTNYRNTNIPATTQQSIFVKIVNRINNDCTGLGEFFIRVLPLPEFDVTTPQIVCLNNPSFIEAETPDGTYTYEWRRNGTLDTSSTSETLNITQGGTYEVTAINTTTLCRRTRRIIVNESIIATLAEDDVTIIDDSANNTITIDNGNNNLGIGDYEFALQDENSVIVRDFQDTPMFENLSGGVYTILVRDKNGCGVAQLEVSVLEFPKYFTPNGDGVNDLWAVKGASTTFYPQSSIHIFDRYGNPITEIAIDGQGWDGLYNGKILPSNDYWFNIQLTDRNGATISRKGHFSLLRK